MKPFLLDPEDLNLLKVITKEEFDKLPDTLKEHYVEKDGKCIPQVEGMVPESDLAQSKARLAEFRDNNVQVMKENEQLKGQLKPFEGVNLEEYATLKSENAKLKEMGAGSAAELPKLIEYYIGKAVKPLQEKLDLAERSRMEAQHKLQIKAVDEYITQYAVKAGVDPDVLPDVLQRARQVFTFKDDQVIAMKGDLPIYSAEHPENPLDAEEWISTSIPKAFFKPSSGGGAEGKPAAGSTRQIRMPSAVEFGKNLDDIASGKVTVV